MPRSRRSIHAMPLELSGTDNQKATQRKLLLGLLALKGLISGLIWPRVPTALGHVILRGRHLSSCEVDARPRQDLILEHAIDWR